MGGAISMKELGSFERDLGHDLSEGDLSAMFKHVDTNGTGSIDLQEFLTMVTSKTKDTDSEEELNESFKEFDKNRDHLISADELLDTMKELGQKLTKGEVDEMIGSADANRDG